jgi:hypothetical protein
MLWSFPHFIGGINKRKKEAKKEKLYMMIMMICIIFPLL